MKTWHKVLLVVIILALVGGGAYWIFRPKSASTSSQTSLYKVAVGTISKELSLSGNVTLRGQVNVTSGVAGKVLAISVEKGNVVSQGQELMRLDPGDLDDQIASAQLNLEIAKLKLQDLQQPLSAADMESLQLSLEKAKEDLASAQRNKERVTQTCSMALSTAQANIQAAQEELERAQANLDLVMQSTAQALAAAQADVDAAQQDLDNAKTDTEKQAAQRSLDQAKQKLESQKLSNQQQITSAQNSVKSAQANLDKVLQALEQQKLQNEASLESAESQIKSAEMALRSAQLQYDQKTAPPSETDLKLQELSVRQAQANLDQLLKQKEATVVISPSAGTVSAVNAQVGDSVGANSVVVTLVDLQSVEISVSVPEVNINQVKPGMSAKVTSDSISGKTMTATLTSVDPLATETQGVVSYTAYFTPDKEASQLLKPGMTVQLSLVVAQAKDVLLVPRSALQTSGNRYLVMVWDGTKFTAQPVGVGILNDQMAEIKSGLNEGDQVAISLEGSVTQSTLGRQGGYFMPGEGIGIPAGEPPSGSRRSP